jgi:DeoR/GlpR family transcriptional regulator of sugar metabolism
MTAEQRINEIVKFVRHPKFASDIRAHFAREWNVSERTVRVFMYGAVKLGLVRRRNGVYVAH